MLAAAFLAAGTAGILASVILVTCGRLNHLGAAGEAAIALGTGMLVMAALAPWRRLKLGESQRGQIRRMIATLRRIEADLRREAVADLPAEGSDEIGELAREIQRIVAGAASVRLETGRLRRTMDQSIRRETERATGRLRKEALTDPLTGLGNRRAVDEVLERMRRSPRVVTLLHVDVDRFKQVNDRCGHDQGDRCLAFLGGLLRAGIRRCDEAFRTGGDEFVVVMPDATAGDGRTVAERIASLFRQMPWTHQETPRPTLSIGVASAIPAGLPDLRELLRRADEAMYVAKRGVGGVIHDHQELASAA
jgi:diguanylate cyclase (GGDEF)-like protein